MPMMTWPDGHDAALPHTNHSNSMSSPRDIEPRRRRKHDSERERERQKDSTESLNTSRDKHRSSRKVSSSTKLPLRRRSTSRERDDRDRDSPRPGSASAERASGRTPVKEKKATFNIPIPEMDRRTAGSYPSFSKAHSRESVRDIPEAEKDDQSKRRHSTPATEGATSRAPPSPPLTADEPDIRRSASGGSMRDVADRVKTKTEDGRRSADSHRRKEKRMHSKKSGTSLQKDARYDDSELSSMPEAFPEDERKSTPNSGYRRTESTTTSNTASQPASTLTEDTTDSDATSIAPERKPSRRPHNHGTSNEYSSQSFADSRPKTPGQDYGTSPHVRSTPVIDVGMANTSTYKSMATPLTAKQMPMPPPPPPPPISGAKEAPRVDYLLKHGGLSHPVPKRLVQTGPTAPVQQYNVYQSPALSQAAPLEEYSKVFGGIHKRLDDYLQVLNNNGSLAVATGYKSVARRLLDKLSQVFARDISSQRCDCVVCKTIPQPNLSDEEDSGVSWGEILEFVAGRRELPQWPPFSIEPDDSGLGISGATAAPMQKLDIDVPDEYRDHYIRQNQKTKRAVQSWLSRQPDFPSSPPEEADEDTLMFAMMTTLPLHQRNLFIALMHGQNFVSASRAPTPAERPSTSSNALRRAQAALKRLYRLDRPPRDCESAMYLLNNPHLHGMLATLAEVNAAEWDILISGRFDGFLWSGAESSSFPPSISAFNSQTSSRVPSRGPNATPFSRNGTPFTNLSAIPSRGPTPFSGGPNDPNAIPSMFPTRGPTPGPNGLAISPPPPVQLDEDTEIAVAAELERNLFLDMERLEDAFELLHSRAESVRQLLRERSSGLAAQSQLRRGVGSDPVGVRLDTPASGMTDFEEEEDDGLGDTVSLAPDDSASQISVNRRHRHRRGERRTPAPEAVREEDESVFEEEHGAAAAGGGGANEAGRKARTTTTTPGGRRSKY
ncbi:unnamed protein product [Zymoseptoria tritici ST99CH_1A5]|uniref:5-Methylcytosine G/T mismatch-specific DNA glycosylase n=1 Tax=Zymoseptoria tritici ST99CH_1A5 TaxID=1276529 RepID=A0A1Y6LNH7_ZYMTR|nr:unnamed protein product [Zymoseptoria tritici ST99CH_1A5]